MQDVKVRASDQDSFRALLELLATEGVAPCCSNPKRLFVAFDDLPDALADVLRSRGFQIVPDQVYDPESAASPGFRTADARIERLVRAMAGASVLDQLASLGVMAVNPELVTERVDETWPGWLWHAESVLDAVLDAVLSHPDGLNGLKADLAKVKAAYEATLPTDGP